MLAHLYLCLAALVQTPAPSPPPIVPPTAPIASVPAHLPQAFTVAFSPDGNWLATSGANHYVTLRDPQTAEVIHVFTGHTALVHQVAFSPDSRTVASASGDGLIFLWSVQERKRFAAFQAWSSEDSVARSLDFSPDGRWLASGAADGTIKIWDLAARKSKYTLQLQTLPVTSVKFSPNSSLLTTATGDWQNNRLPGSLRLWDVATGKELAELAGHAREIKRVDFTSDGKRLVSTGAERTAIIWDLATRSQTQQIKLPATASALAVVPDRDWLAIGDTRGGVALWSLTTGEPIQRYTGHEAAVLGIAFNPQPELLATASHDGTVKIWPLPDTSRGASK